MAKKAATWRAFLRERGFVNTKSHIKMWMRHGHFYIRRAQKGEPKRFASCSGAMHIDGAFHATIEEAFAAYITWLLTQNPTKGDDPP